MAFAEPVDAASFSAAGRLMSAIHTKAPARASSFTVDSPMPLAPPVTSAWRPVSPYADSVRLSMLMRSFAVHSAPRIFKHNGPSRGESLSVSKPNCHCAWTSSAVPLVGIGGAKFEPDSGQWPWFIAESIESSKVGCIEAIAARSLSSELRAGASARIAPERRAIHDADLAEVSFASGFNEPRISARRLWRGGRSRGVSESRTGQEDRSRGALLGQPEHRPGQSPCARQL